MAYKSNHLFYDYYGFPKEMYEVKFESKGSPEIADKVLKLLNEVSLNFFKSLLLHFFFFVC